LDLDLPDGAEGPVSRLRWYPERGFELDLNAAVDDVTLMLVAVPLPADGTVELTGGPLELDKLEILFKAQIDVAGAPGQLTEATVTLVAEGQGHTLVMKTVVEDAETGETRDLEVKAPVEIPAGAPEAGGPRPSPADEAELDWDDDDTHEAFFKDPLTQEDPLPIAGRSGRRADGDEDEDESDDASQAASGAERGFDRLLKALLAEDSMLDASADDAPAPASQRVTSGGTVLSLVEGEGDVDPGPGAPSISDPGDARGLLGYLVEREALEIEEGHSVDELVEGAAPIVASPKPPAARAAALSNWLFSQDAVAELYMDDEALGALLEQW